MKVPIFQSRGLVDPEEWGDDGEGFCRSRTPAIVHRKGAQSRKAPSSGPRPSESKEIQDALLRCPGDIEALADATVCTMWVAGVEHEGGGQALGLAPVDSIDPARRPTQGPRSVNRIHLVALGGVDGLTQVWAESNLERQHLVNLAWMGPPVAVATQPCLLTWRTSDDRYVVHYPDMLVEHADGHRWLCDVRPTGRWDNQFVLKCLLTAAWCARQGIGYRVWADMPPARMVNLFALQRYKSVSGQVREQADRLEALLTEPHSIAGLKSLLGGNDKVIEPLRHLMWHRRVHFDINSVVRGSTWLLSGPTDPLADAFTLTADDLLLCARGTESQR